MTKRILTSVAIGAASVLVLSALGRRSRLVERCLAECYLIAAAFGSVHSPNSVVYYGVQIGAVALAAWGTQVVVVGLSKRGSRS